MAGQEIKGLAQISASGSSSLRHLELLVVSIGGNFLQTPPLPIQVCPFLFLTRVDLSSVGLNVEEIPFKYGWELKKFEIVEIGFEDFHIRDIGKMFGHEIELTGSECMLEESGVVEEGSGGTEDRTGPVACSQEISEEGCREKTLREEFLKKRKIKTRAGRIDLSPSSFLKRQRTQTPKTTPTKKTKTTRKATVSPPPRSTRKSLRLALPLSAKKPRKGISGSQVPEQVEEIVSSPDENPIEPENTLQEQGSPLVPDRATVDPENTPQEQGLSSVLAKHKPKSSKKPALKLSPPTRTSKRKTSSKRISVSDSEEEFNPESEEESTPSPPSKRAKPMPSTMLTPTLVKFLKRNVVKGKIFKVSYFHQHGLEIFLDKVRAQGWSELFTNTHLRCSAHELAEFYSNCSVEQGEVVSRVGGKSIRFDAEKLGDILGVPCMGFDIYVREDKSVLGEGRLLDLARSLSQNESLDTPRPIKKGEMTPLNQLIYWFLLKNIIPRGQGRNHVDAMSQCLIDLMAREEQINLPALMVKHIERIANPSRVHDLGYGFLLTMVFDYFGVKLTKPVGVTFLDEIGRSTLLGCGLTLAGNSVQEQGSRTPCPPVPAGPSGSPNVDALIQAQAQLASELTMVKSELDAERAETITRYETLLSLLRNLTAQLPQPPAP